MNIKKRVSTLHRDEVKKVNKKHVVVATAVGALSIFAGAVAIDKFNEKSNPVIVNEQFIEERIEKTLDEQLKKITTNFNKKIKIVEDNVEDIFEEMDKIDTKIKKVQHNIDNVSDKVSTIPKEYTNNDELDKLIDSIVVSNLIGLESKILKSAKQYIGKKIDEIPTPPAVDVIDEKLFAEKIKQMMYYDLAKLETRLVKRIQEQFNERVIEIENDVKEIQEDKTKKRNSLQHYVTTLTAQQNLLVTLQVYNNLYQMVKTKDGRNFIGNEIHNIKVVNQRLIKLRRQIYSDATKADKQIIFETYQNMIRTYKPVIPKDEAEKESSSNNINNTSK